MTNAEIRKKIEELKSEWEKSRYTRSVKIYLKKDISDLEAELKKREDELEYEFSTWG